LEKNPDFRRSGAGFQKKERPGEEMVGCFIPRLFARPASPKGIPRLLLFCHNALRQLKTPLRIREILRF
jgi:hypothetical protein